MSEVHLPARELPEKSLGRTYEGWAFTFCKAAFLALLFNKYTLLVTAGLSTVFYVLASLQGVREWRCFAKPPWVTLFWGAVFVGQCWKLFFAHGVTTQPPTDGHGSGSIEIYLSDPTVGCPSHDDS